MASRRVSLLLLGLLLVLPTWYGLGAASTLWGLVPAQFHAPAWHPGQYWVWEAEDAGLRVEERVIGEVLVIRAGEVQEAYETSAEVWEAGELRDSFPVVYLKRDLATFAVGGNVYPEPVPDLSFPLEVGKQWTVDVAVGSASAGLLLTERLTFSALRLESVRVPAGEFRAMLIERTAELVGIPAQPGHLAYYYAPAVGNVIRTSGGFELVAFGRGSAPANLWTGEDRLEVALQLANIAGLLVLAGRFGRSWQVQQPVWFRRSSSAVARGAGRAATAPQTPRR